MRVAYLFGSLNRGGTETLMLDVFRNAQEGGLHAIGVYRKKGGVLENDFSQSGVYMHHLPIGKNFLAYVFRLRSLLRKQQITHVHAEQPLDALYAYFACFMTSRKVILSLHGYDFSAKKTEVQILKYILPRTAKNVYVSRTQEDYYCKKYHLKKEKQFVVYNGIDFSKFNKSNNDNVSNIRQELSLAPDTLLLGMVGNFNQVRDHMTVCRFYKLLADNNINFHGVFIGKKVDTSGYLYDDCVTYCHNNELNNRVSFLGVRKGVPHLLSQLDAFIYSTNHDTFGIAVVEAIAAGIPVFVNDWDVMKEITENGRYAVLYKTQDEYDLLAKFIDYIDRKSEYDLQAKASASAIREHFNIQNHIRSLKKLYEELINK